MTSAEAVHLTVGEYGFDLAQEDFDGHYAKVAEGVYTFSERHYPAGVVGFGHINNRGFVYVLKDEGEDILLMNGIPSDECIPNMKKLEEDLGLKLKIIMGSGDFHHMSMKFWLDAFPDVPIYHSGIKFPKTRNGAEILANPEYKKRITLVTGPTFPEMERFSDQVQFIGFNQFYTYTDKAYMSKNSKETVKKGLFSFLKSFASEPADQQFLAVWTYHVPTKTLITEHNFKIYISAEHHKLLPFMMRRMQKKEVFGSEMNGPMPKGPTDAKELKTHCAQMAEVLKLDVRFVMDYHSWPGVFARRYGSKDEYVEDMTKVLAKTGEHLADGSGMAKKGGCCCTIC